MNHTKKTALTLTLSVTLLLSVLFVYTVQGEQWNTIQIPTPNLHPFGEPSITYDGSKIAFVSSQLFVVNSDGTGLTQVTNMSNSIDGLSFSENGGKLAFLSKAGELEYDLYVSSDLENVNKAGPTVSPIASPSSAPSSMEPSSVVVIAIISVASVFAVGTGLIIYFKKRNHQAENGLVKES